jgi:AraC family transcriptional regulator
MPDLPLITQALDFVEENLKEPIGVADMAAAVGYSLHHFCRTFNEATHHTPYDYLMRRRLAEAARALLQADDKIIDVALHFQFSSPETFSRAFKRVFGLQPSQWRQEGCVDDRRLMPRLTLAHLQHSNKGPYLKPVLVERDAFHVAGVMTLVRDDRTAITELWQILVQELKGRGDAKTLGESYGITFYPAGRHDPSFFYMAAVEVDDLEFAGPALVAKTIPALTCARFIHKGPARELPLTLDYVYHTWLPKSGMRLSHPWIIEHYGDAFQGADQQREVWVYIPVE